MSMVCRAPYPGYYSAAQIPFNPSNMVLFPFGSQGRLHAVVAPTTHNSHPCPDPGTRIRKSGHGCERNNRASRVELSGDPSNKRGFRCGEAQSTQGTASAAICWSSMATKHGVVLFLNPAGLLTLGRLWRSRLLWISDDLFVDALTAAHGA
jgi:hypothetical protein